MERKKEGKKAVVRRAGLKETTVAFLAISMTSTVMAKSEGKNVACKEICLKVKCTNIISERELWIYADSSHKI